ncbi:hypothetical protein BC829DRAFT_67473 [Chytridium lagenaria]|nr:hypothetical protein BC829DRAFT_67473 [Chytridium lagenaria]
MCGSAVFRVFANVAFAFSLLFCNLNSIFRETAYGNLNALYYLTGMAFRMLDYISTVAAPNQHLHTLFTHNSQNYERWLRCLHVCLYADNVQSISTGKPRFFENRTRPSHHEIMTLANTYSHPPIIFLLSPVSDILHTIYTLSIPLSTNLHELRLQNVQLIAAQFLLESWATQLPPSHTFSDTHAYQDDRGHPVDWNRTTMYLVFWLGVCMANRPILEYAIRTNETTLPSLLRCFEKAEEASTRIAEIAIAVRDMRGVVFFPIIGYAFYWAGMVFLDLARIGRGERGSERGSERVEWCCRGLGCMIEMWPIAGMWMRELRDAVGRVPIVNGESENTSSHYHPTCI